jgi:hypothetical protein
MRHTFCSIIFTSLLASGLSLAAPQAPVNPPPTPAPPARGELAGYRQRLALSADQQVQFRTILQDRKAQIAAVRNDASLSPKNRNRQIKEIRLATNNKLRALLTDAQAVEFDQIQRERQQQMQNKRQTTPPPPPQD